MTDRAGENTLTMIRLLLVDQAEADGPEPDQSCPDTGRCTHRCTDICWRSIWCLPLSAYGDKWPEDTSPRPAQPSRR